MRPLPTLTLAAKVRLGWRLVRDPRVPLAVRAIFPALLLYLLLPFDVIPDFIPFLGQLDDAALVFLAWKLLVRLSPRHVVEEHARALGA